MASAVCLLDSKGAAIVSRDFRGEVGLSEMSAIFGREILNGRAEDIKPIFSVDGVSYAWIKRNDIYAVAATRQLANCAVLISFLNKLFELFTIFYGKLEEDVIRDNFVICYEVMDEVMDNGIVQLTESKILKKMMTCHGKQGRVETAQAPSSIASAVSWRADNVKHKKNEIFLDVVERIDCVIANNGSLLRSEIVGCFRLKSFLSGMPELKLGLNDRLTGIAAANARPITSGGPPSGGASQFGGVTGGERSGTASAGSASVDLEDVRFHQCVRLIKYEQDRTISFIPPDGPFELMTYRISSAVSELPFWVECTLSPASFDPNATKVDYLIKIKSNFKQRSVASVVELAIPAPEDASSPKFRVSSGHVKFIAEKSMFYWTIKSFQGHREQLLSASLSRPTVKAPNLPDFSVRPIELKFEIPFFTLSGVTVRYLRVFEPSGYQALPWVRYITQNGNYQIRMT